MAEQPQKDFLKKEFKLDWVISDDLRAVYANHMLVSHQDGQFILSFGEANVPPMLDESDFENAGDSLPCRVFLRIALPTSRIPGMIKALQTNYEGYLRESNSGLFNVESDTDD